MISRPASGLANQPTTVIGATASTAARNAYLYQYSTPWWRLHVPWKWALYE
ncbi:hypothetical protein [Actinacidiphila oryziradicis]|uniref:hypothetical protein n=1 Tax=Actinacidiphila oryziradicis TaxID=2571141 RepID=UPI001B8000E0|nr:hypothetical protein [Actinacidiphila oryziradicis]